MDNYLSIAEKIVTYQLRTRWFEVAKMFSAIAEEHDGTLSMAFVLLAINDEFGTPVTKIAPRLGMEPNSLSRILASMEKKGTIYKRKDKKDKRKVYICLTNYGKQMRNISFQQFTDFESKLHQEIGEEKLSIFFDVMKQIETTSASYSLPSIKAPSAKN